MLSHQMYSNAAPHYITSCELHVGMRMQAVRVIGHTWHAAVMIAAPQNPACMLHLKVLRRSISGQDCRTGLSTESLHQSAWYARKPCAIYSMCQELLREGGM